MMKSKKLKTNTDVRLRKRCIKTQKVDYGAEQSKCVTLIKFIETNFKKRGSNDRKGAIPLFLIVFIHCFACF